MTDKEERKPLLVGGGVGQEPIPTAPPPGEQDEPPPYMETPSVPQPCKCLDLMIYTSNKFYIVINISLKS